jgi:hypothetical protein
MLAPLLLGLAHAVVDASTVTAILRASHARPLAYQTAFAIVLGGRRTTPLQLASAERSDTTSAGADRARGPYARWAASARCQDPPRVQRHLLRR